MISEHAMLVLMLLLAIAVVLLSVALTLYASKMESRLKSIDALIKERDMSSNASGTIE